MGHLGTFSTKAVQSAASHFLRIKATVDKGNFRGI